MRTLSRADEEVPLDDSTVPAGHLALEIHDRVRLHHLEHAQHPLRFLDDNIYGHRLVHIRGSRGRRKLLLLGHSVISVN